jgi:hypothetical protein
MSVCGFGPAVQSRLRDRARLAQLPKGGEVLALRPSVVVQTHQQIYAQFVTPLDRSEVCGAQFLAQTLWYVKVSGQIGAIDRAACELSLFGPPSA